MIRCLAAFAGGTLIGLVLGGAIFYAWLCLTDGKAFDV